MTSARREAVAYLALLVAGTSFAANLLAARGMADTIPPFALAFWRWSTLALIVLPFAWRDLAAHRAIIRERWAVLFVLGAVGMGFCGVTLYLAGHTTEATNMALIASTSPVVVVIGARLFLDERMNAIQLGGVALALVGVVIIIVRGDAQVLVHLRFTAGDLWVLVSSAGWAVYAIMLKRERLALPGLALLGTGAAAGALSLLPFVAWETATVGPPELSAPVVSTVLTLALLPSLVGYGLHSHATKVLGANRASLMGYITLVAVVALAWLVLGERLESYHLAGGAAVLAGVWLTSRNRSVA